MRVAFALLLLAAVGCGPDPRLVELEKRVAAQDVELAQLRMQIATIHTAAVESRDATIAVQESSEKALKATQEMLEREKPVAAVALENEQLKREKLQRESNDNGIAFRGKPVGAH